MCKLVEVIKGIFSCDKKAKVPIFTGIRTLSEKDASFAIIGIRCNSNESRGKRKMVAGRLYPLMQGYEITDEGITVDKWRLNQNLLYDDYYTYGINGKPHIQLCAIVGQNGAGKSSIVEFMMRLINNFAAATIGETGLGPAAERLHYIDFVDGELWYLMNNNAYHLIIKNALVKLIRFEYQETQNGKICYSNEHTIFDNHRDTERRIVEDAIPSLDATTLRNHYQHFFYTMVSNQSIYAYNTMDFTEYNSDEKEAIVLGDKIGTTYDVEEKSWLHGIFHKNDGYMTPLVIMPFRREGMMDINKENLLAKERLINLFVKQKELRLVNDHLWAESLSYSYEPGVDYLALVRKTLNFKNITEEGLIRLRHAIVSCWSGVVGKDLAVNILHRPYYDYAIDYLVYKTLKVSANYKEHHSFYEKYQQMTDQFDFEDVKVLVASESTDRSHITRKVFRTIAYLMFDVYQLHQEAEGMRSENTIDFDKLKDRWKKYAVNKTGVDMSIILNHLQQCALMLPPFLCMRINLCEKDNPKVKIDFETLSSGEKQQIYTISSVLYHLDNLHSVKADENDPNRIKYDYVNVILEEIELYYHPELQQQFVMYLIDGLNRMNLEGINGINIIIVTHSPYVLSDIPKSNVLALRKDVEEPETNLQTFGANIHDMLRNSFFLNKGSIGRFAQWEIGHLKACMEVHRWAIKTIANGGNVSDCPMLEKNDEVYRFLKRYSVNQSGKWHFSYEHFCYDLSKEHIKAKIELMDEPVVYHILMKELADTFPELEQNVRTLRKARLQKEIEELDKED